MRPILSRLIPTLAIALCAVATVTPANAALMFECDPASLTSTSSTYTQQSLVHSGNAYAIAIKLTCSSSPCVFDNDTGGGFASMRWGNDTNTKEFCPFPGQEISGQDWVYGFYSGGTTCTSATPGATLDIASYSKLSVGDLPPLTSGTLSSNKSIYASSDVCGGYVTGQTGYDLAYRIYDADPFEAVCDNGILEDSAFYNTPEECEDGNTTNGDGCSSTCQSEGSYSQTCGDGILDSPEACDDGDTDNGDGCDSTCAVETGYVCVGAPSSCSVADIYVQTCGDGIVDAPEECDDGDTVNSDGCDASCAIETANVCQEAPSLCEAGAVYLAACGDEIIDNPETCDDGNASNGDGCSSTCAIESGWWCENAPSSCVEENPPGEPTTTAALIWRMWPALLVAAALAIALL